MDSGNRSKCWCVSYYNTHLLFSTVFVQALRCAARWGLFSGRFSCFKADLTSRCNLDEWGRAAPALLGTRWEREGKRKATAPRT